jgi:hypothetical protein
VQVRLVFHGRVDVDDEFDVVNVHATGCDIGRNENLDAPRTERLKVPIALRLRQVSV